MSCSASMLSFGIASRSGRAWLILLSLAQAKQGLGPEEYLEEGRRSSRQLALNREKDPAGNGILGGFGASGLTPNLPLPPQLPGPR